MRADRIILPLLASTINTRKSHFALHRFCPLCAENLTDANCLSQSLHIANCLLFKTLFFRIPHLKCRLPHLASHSIMPLDATTPLINYPLTKIFILLNCIYHLICTTYCSSIMQQCGYHLSDLILTDATFSSTSGSDTATIYQISF